METLLQISQQHTNTPESHTYIKNYFDDQVNSMPELKAHRDWVEANIFGFGERSFHYMWHLLVSEMPKRFSFLEIGVFRGQVLSLIQLLADIQNKKCIRYGVTPLDSSDGHWESDYRKDIETMHSQFNLKQDYELFVGLSTDAKIIDTVFKNVAKVDLLYIDGGHTYETVKSDIENYLPLLKVGGYLIIDDCANRFNLPTGYFAGIDTVSKATDEVLPPFHYNPQFQYLFNVVHNRIWIKLKTTQKI